MLLVTAKLPYISVDVWYWRLPNNTAGWPLAHRLALLLTTADRLRLTTVNRDRTRPNIYTIQNTCLIDLLVLELLSFFNVSNVMFFKPWDRNCSPLHKHEFRINGLVCANSRKYYFISFLLSKFLSPILRRRYIINFNIMILLSRSYENKEI